MKFSDIIKILDGATARRPAEVAALRSNVPIKVDVRILMPEDDADIEEAAVAFAQKHKVADPKPGNSQYERGLMLHGLLRSCLDPDVKDKDEPYFASVEEIAHHLDDARAAFLHFQQRAFQREVSPNPGSGDKLEFLRLLYASADAEAKGEDPSTPFVGLPYGALVNFSMQAASTLSVLLRQQSSSGSEKLDSGVTGAASSPASTSETSSTSESAG